MSNTPTLRERLARLEVLMENHIHSHEIRDRWFLRVLGGLVIGVILLAMPGCARLLAGMV
jgi:hypothetical protein